MKVFKNNDSLVITFSDGFQYISEKPEEDWDWLMQENPISEKRVRQHFDTKRDGTLWKRANNSNVLTVRGASIYMTGGAEISLPIDFALQIIDAEEKDDKKTLQKLTNFWKLLCLNPDGRVINNLFWFLRKWDVEIAPSGFIVAYRNAVLKTEGTYSVKECQDIITAYYQAKLLGTLNEELTNKYDEVINSINETTPVFTDAHSGTTTIKLGSPVKIPRKECDPKQEHSCSRGSKCGPAKK